MVPDNTIEDTGQAHSRQAVGADVGGSDAAGGDPPAPTVVCTTRVAPASTVGSGSGERASKAAQRVGATPDGFEVLEELGRGAMGVVYKAQQKGLNRLVALKMILAGGHAGEELLGRFQTEAEAVAKLQHPNIVQIYEIGQHDGRPFFALEYVDGGTLHERLDGTPLSAREAAELMVQLACAVDYAHQCGVVHRDLKPANVLLERSREPRDESSVRGVTRRQGSSFGSRLSTLTHAPSLCPKITDFGLAKQTEGDSGLTRTNAVMGTPSYMAPEQAAGHSKDVGPFADVYALGAILYETLTGRPPFRASTVVETLQQVISQEPVPPTRLQAAVPRDLETICLKCLEKDAGRRYATACELADDLRRFLEGVPITARPVSTAERVWRWARRNRAIAASLAVIALLLIATSVGSMIAAGSFRELAGEKEQESFAAKEARDLAEKAEDEAYEARDRARRDQRDAEASRRRAEELAESSDRKAYASDMTLASRYATQLNGIGRVREIVDRWTPAPGKTDRRKWEWHYMKSLTHREVARLAQRGRAVDVTWDSRSKAVLVVDAPGLIESHDAETGRIRRLVNSPKRIKTASWSTDRTLVAVACVDDRIRVWNVTTAQLLADLDVGQDSVLGLAWHPGGQWLAATTDKHEAIVWDWRRREIARRLDAVGFGENVIAWHPHKPLLAADAEGGGVAVIDVVSGEVQCRLHSGYVRCIRWNPDGRRIAIPCDEGIGIWDLERQERVTTIEFESVTALAWGPKGKKLAVSSKDRTIRIWDDARGTVIHILRGHSGDILNVAWSPDGRFLASSGWDRMFVWDAVLGTDDLTEPVRSACCRWLPDPDQIAVASEANVRILNTTTRVAEERWTVRTPISALAFDSSGKRVAYRGGNRRVWISERGESSERIVLDEGTEKAWLARLRFSNHRQSIAWSPDDSLVAAVGRDEQVAVWNAASGSLVGTPRQLSGRVLVLAWSPDGRTLAYGGDGGELALWDVERRRELLKVPVGGYVLGLQWKPDGSQLMRSGVSWIDVLDARSGDRVRILKGPAGGTSCVTATRDFSRIAAGSGDGVVAIWDGDTGGMVASFKIHPSEAYWVRWNADETQLASAGWDDTLRVYDAQIGLEQAHDPRAIGRIARALAAGPTPFNRICKLHEFAVEHACPGQAIPSFEAAHSREPERGGIAFRLADLLRQRAELHRSAGRFDEAYRDDERAGVLFKQLADSGAWVVADTLFRIDRLERWSILRPTEMRSGEIERLELLPDGSMLASGSLRDGETYAIRARCALANVTAIRLEAFDHPSLYEGGPGRGRAFQLDDIHVEVAADEEEGEFTEVPISRVTVDANQPGREIHGRAEEDRSGIRGSWVGDSLEGRRIAVFNVNRTRFPSDGCVLRIKLTFRGDPDEYASLGRVRLSVTDSASTGEALVRQKMLGYLGGKPGFRRAAWLWHRKQWDESLATLEKAIPFDSTGPRFLAALLNYELGNDQVAREHLDNAVKACRSGTYRPADYLFGPPALRQGAAKGHNSVSHRRLHAEMLSRVGSVDQAVVELEKLVEEGDADVRTFDILGRIHIQRSVSGAGSLNPAIETLSKGMESFPDSVGLARRLVSVWSDKANAHERNGRWQEAADAYNQGARICENRIVEDPGDSYFRSYAATKYRGICRAFRQLGRTDKARDAWMRMCRKERNLMALAPGRAPFHNNLAWYLVTSPFPELRNALEALEYAETATSLEPGSGVYWNTLGVVRYRLDDLDASLAAFDKASERRFGGDAAEWYFRAMVHHRQGDVGRAGYWIRRANRWAEKNEPRNEELERFRVEAEELLAEAPISHANSEAHGNQPTGADPYRRNVPSVSEVP